MLIAAKRLMRNRILPIILVTIFLLLLLPAGASAEVFSAVVTSQSMGVYSDAYLSRQIGYLEAGTVVQVGSYTSSVALIRYVPTGAVGYAPVASLSRVSDVSQPATVTGSNARLYLTASTSSASQKLSRGLTVNVLATSGDWAYVEISGVGGYTYVNNLSIGSQDAAPTAAPTASNPLANFVSCVQTCVVAADSFIYQLPDASSTQIGAVTAQSKVIMGAYSRDWNWVYVNANGVIGYMPLNQVLPGSQAAFPDNWGAEVLTSTSLYQVANTSSTALASLAAGENVRVIAYNGTWVCVQTTAGQYGYIPQKLLRAYVMGATTSTPTPTPTVPSSSGDGFRETNGQVIYETLSVVTNQSVAVYTKPSASSVQQGILSAGVRMTALAYNDDWVWVTLNGNYGYCLRSALTPDGGAVSTPNPSDPLEDFVQYTCYAVLMGDAQIFAAPDAGGEVLGAVHAGDKVLVGALDKNLTWAYVNTGSVIGFVAMNTLLPESSVAFPTNMGALALTDTRMYQVANTSSTVLSTLSRGDSVTVLAYGRSWVYARTQDNKVGYIPLSTLKAYEITQSTPAPSTPTDVIPATVTADALIVYAAASTSAQQLGMLQRGEQVNVVEINSRRTWAYIEKSGNYGYCLLAGLTANAYLPEETPPATTVQFTATVVYPNAPIYASYTNMTGSGAASAALGASVDVYAYNSDLGAAYVGVNGQKGYMHISHLNRTEYPTLASGSSGSSVLTLQKALESLGYFDGLPAGNYETLTQQAVLRFQSAAGLPSNGVADQTTLRVLFGGYAPSSPILQTSLSKGSTGENVLRLQTRLYYKEYFSSTSSLDGDFGSNTQAAVKQFQTVAGLSVSGVADAATMQLLFSSNAPKNTSTTPDDDSPPVLPSDPTRDQKIEYVCELAMQQLGKPYVFGAAGPSKYDCSGLTLYCFKAVGVTLPHSAYLQGYTKGTKISSISDLQRGDIICMDTSSDSDLSDHVGIYLGDGMMIHASSGGGKVQINTILSGYYNSAYSWGRRVL